MKVPHFHLDAFTAKPFKGNPASVCVLQRWLPDPLMQAIATENGQSETAFISGGRGRYDIRWFTPSVEIDLCGHATLASAYVVTEIVEPGVQRVQFFSQSGILKVERSDELFLMDFPARPGAPVEITDELTDALGIRPLEVYKARDLMAVFGSEEEVRDLTPDFNKLAAIKDAFGFIVTAPGKGVDFVSRFFAPSAGIPEDPVTGSAHCTLIPYWSKRLGKAELNARQISARGGELYCENIGERVIIGGGVVLYSRGEIYIDTP